MFGGQEKQKSIISMHKVKLQCPETQLSYSVVNLEPSMGFSHLLCLPIHSTNSLPNPGPDLGWIVGNPRMNITHRFPFSCSLQLSREVDKEVSAAKCNGLRTEGRVRRRDNRVREGRGFQHIRSRSRATCRRAERLEICHLQGSQPTSAICGTPWRSYCACISSFRECTLSSHPSPGPLEPFRSIPHRRRCWERRQRALIPGQRTKIPHAVG